MAQLNLEPVPATFEKPEDDKRQHPKALFLKGFVDGKTITKMMALGALCVDLTIGNKTLPTTFFVINGKGSYSLLLGRDWIHANCCILSTMHQCLIQWIDDAVEIVSVDSSFNIASAEAHTIIYDNVSCFYGQAWEKDFLRLSYYESASIQASSSPDES